MWLMCVILLTFVALGTFVYSLASREPMAGILGAGLVVLTVATVAGFRAGARNAGGIKRQRHRDRRCEYLGAAAAS